MTARLVKILTSALFLLALVHASFANATTNLSASVDRTNVSVGEQIALTIEVSSDEETVGEPRFPNLTTFDVYSSGRTQSIQWVNGKMSLSVTYNYLLSARSQGSHVIPSATLKAGGKEYHTTPIRITVSPARTRQQQPPSATRQQPAATAKPPANRRIFVTAELDRDTAYVNQAVTYIFRFYQGERLLSSPEYHRSTFPGFWLEDLPPQNKYSKIIDNVRYEVTEIRYALFPTDAGPKQIGQTRLKATIRSARRNSKRRDPFSIFGDDIFGRFDRGEQVNLTTDPVSLVVLPLPAENRPENFSGLVGNFSLSIEADERTVTVGDPLTVRVSLQGTGNIKSAPMPSFDTIPDLRTFSAGSSENVSTAGYKVSGTKTFDQVFVPQRPGRYRLPSFSISFFDPNVRKY